LSQGKNNSRFIKRKVPQPKYPLIPKNIPFYRNIPLYRNNPLYLNIPVYRKIQTHAGVQKYLVQGIPRLFRTVAPIIGGSSVWKLIHVKVRATRLFQNSWAPIPKIYGGVALILGRLRFKPRLSDRPETFTWYCAVRPGQGWRILWRRVPELSIIFEEFFRVPIGILKSKISSWSLP
jgi:hypothetical protein